MNAIVQRGYGAPDEVLELRDVGTPVAGDDEVLVRVRAASLHPDVWHVVRGLPYVLRIMGSGLRRPKNPIPGTDMAGLVESVGGRVTRFRPGDEVFGETVRGHQWQNGGAYAEYVAVAESALAAKPAAVTFEEAAAVPTSGLIALNCLLNQGSLERGQRVLINGAGGGVGTIAVQLAKAHGAAVTGVDRAEKLEMIRSLGADRVIDHTREDFTRGTERYDLILDVAGILSLAACRRALTPRGTYVLVDHDHYGARGRRVLGGLPRGLAQVAMSRFVRHLPRSGFSTPPKGPSMEVLRRLLEERALTPAVDSTFPLAEVPQALRYLEEGRARGKIVITV